MSGVVENQDAYMKGRIGQRAFYDRLPSVLDAAFADWARLTGRRYAAVDAYRTTDADEIVVAMGTIADTAMAVVDALRESGRRVGSVAVTSFRPFPEAALAEVLRGARAVGVIERTDEPAAADNPLTRETKAALYGAATDRGPRVLSVSAGLGSRDVAPGDVAAVFDWLAGVGPGGPARHAVLGIRHPLALASTGLDATPRGAYAVRGHSIGGLGSVTTNKLLASLVGELFGKHVQAYPRYGSEKKGLPTTFFLTIADEPIRTHAELRRVDFVPVHGTAAFSVARPLEGLVDGGTVFVQSALGDADAIWASIPETARTEIEARDIRVVALDTAGLARAHAPRPDLVVRMQGVALAGVFLRVAPFAAAADLDRGTLMSAVRRQLVRFFGKRGGRVVDANLAVIEAAYDGVIDVRGGDCASGIRRPSSDSGDTDD